MLLTMGSTYSVHTKLPTNDVQTMNKRLTCMGCWPTVYTPDEWPSDSADYMSVIYAEGDHYAQWELMDALKQLGCTSARWLADFFKEVQ